MVRLLRLENTRWGFSTLSAADVDKVLEFDPKDGRLHVHVLDTPRLIDFQLTAHDLDSFLSGTVGQSSNPSTTKVIHNQPVQGAYSAPFKLYLDITSACSLSCPFCLRSEGSGSALLSTTIVQEVARELAQLGVMYVKIGGGDPLLHPDLLEILCLLRSAGCFLTMSTNSVTITPDLARVIKHNDVRVSVSVEGMRSTNDSLRGDGHFDMALRAVEILRAANVEVLLRTTLLGQNLAEVPQLVELGKSLGTKIKFAYCRPAGSAVSNQLMVGPAERAAYLRAVDFLNQPDILPYVLLDEGMMLRQPSEIVPRLFRGRMCGAANRSMHIDPAGRVSPCIFMGPTFSYGTVYRDGTIADFWRGFVGNKFQAVRDIRQPRECDECDRICKNECIANRFYFWGTFERQDPNCLNCARGET